MISKYEAINALYNGNVTQKSDGTFEYHNGGDIPTEEQIKVKLDELQAQYDSTQYARDRQKEYPNLGEQFDKIFHAIDADSDLKTKFSDFHTAIKAVKDKYPKPSE